MAKKNYDVKNLMINENTISILGVIGDDWWEENNTSNEFLREFKALEKKFDHIVVEINSPGGSVFHGQPIYNAIKNSSVKTSTRVIGMAASMAGVIALAGDEVECFDNAILMLHSPLNFTYGNAKDFREMADTLDKFADTLIVSVAKKIGKTPEETKNLFFDYEDHFLTASEAKEVGLIDAIIDEAADLPDGINDMQMTDIMAYYSDKYSAKPKKRSPIQNFFSNINNKNSKMKIDAQLINALNIDAGATIEQAVKAIQDIVSARDDAQAKLTAEQDAHKLVQDKVATLEADLATSKTSVTDITSERDTLQEQINKAAEILDTISDDIKKEEDFTKKLDAFTSFTDEEETKAFLAKDKAAKSAPKNSWDEDADSFI